MTTAILTAFGGILLGAMGWLALEFVGRPVRGFFDLRREVHQQLMFLANVAVPSKASSYGHSAHIDAILASARGIDVEAEKAAHAREVATFESAVTTLRRLGTQMKAFGETEFFAALSVRLLGFDPVKAGSGLIGLSNSLHEYGQPRASHRATIEEALKLRGE